MNTAGSDDNLEDGRYHAPDLADSLHPTQLVADTTHPVPRAQLTPRVRAALWALRIFVLLLTAMVVYTFIAQLT